MKEKVFCSKCKHGSSIVDELCFHPKEITKKFDFYFEDIQASETLMSIKNKHNNCKDFESYPKGKSFFSRFGLDE